jgi:hypothetical protein
VVHGFSLRRLHCNRIFFVFDGFVFGAHSPSLGRPRLTL